jgi:PucR family transcriptional regulator, purine catabolism regulatory protein
MVALAAVLAREDLALVRWHLPRPESAVRWVATSELADPTPFLEGGEVLLTTGLNTAGWRSEWRPYVARLVAGGLTALGLGTGLTHATVPTSLLSACREHGLNLFEVPRATTFVAISRATAALLDAEEQATARESLRMQRELTAAALHPDQPGRLLARLATFVGGGVRTLRQDGEPNEGPFGDPAWSGDELGAHVQRIRGQGLRAASSVSEHGTTTLVHPIGLRGRPEGYLAVRAREPMADPARNAVTTAVVLLSLAAESRADRRAAQRRLAGRAYELLLHGDPHGAAIALAAGTDRETVDLPGRVRVLRSSGEADALERGLALLEGGPAVVARLVGDQLQAVLPEGGAPVGRGLVDLGLHVGVGGVVPAAQLGRSHAEAGGALTRTGEGAPVVDWVERARSGALAVMEPDQATAFARSYLAPVLDDAGLVETLRTFLRRHGAVGPVAEELGVHRNTVRNRLRQVESRLGRSLDDPQTRVDCWLALQALDRAPE